MGMRIFEVVSKASEFVFHARAQLGKAGLLGTIDVGLLPKGDRHVEITTLEVRRGNKFGQGVGTKTITILTKLADKLGVRLSLLPRSSFEHDDDPRYKTAPNQDALENWYEKYGFEFVPNPDRRPGDLEYSEEMFRQPRGRA
jgi:hypothetical protein